MSATGARVRMRALVLGASGQIGHFLLPELRAREVIVEAVSRQPHAAREGITWTRFDLYHVGDAQHPPDVVFSAGPLDGLMRWLSRTRHRPTHVVAFSSTSAQVKQTSSDPRERELAERLLQGERALAAYCDARGIGWTLLRPTLVYGCGMDANLSRVAALARRWRLVPVPRTAMGLRQPVHAQDLAICAWRVANTPESKGKRYDLPGGETLPYSEMLRRTVSAMNPPGHLLRLPEAAFRLLLWTLRRAGRISDFGPAMLERMRQDLVFSGDEARRDLGWAPRGFQPTAVHFQRPGEAKD